MGRTYRDNTTKYHLTIGTVHEVIVYWSHGPAKASNVAPFLE
jgi:hypothetical protein